MTIVPPPVLALAAGFAQRALTGPTPRPGPARTALTAATSVASLAIAFSASGTFRRAGTTVQPFRPEQASVLVTTGANSISRNPMYVGMAGTLLAHATWRGRWVALVPAAGFVAYIDRVQVRAEESALRTKFGADYAAYTARVPRWLGVRR